MRNDKKMSRRQFLAVLGVSALSLAAARIATLDTTLRAIVPDVDRGTPYGTSSYGERH